MTAILGLLGVGRGDVVAVVGAGGKTTLVYRLAAEARAAGMRVLVTTTTHMGTLPEAITGPVFVEADGDVSEALEDALAHQGLATLLGRRFRADKLEGIPPEHVDALARHAGVDLVLVEADGARQRSLKVPAPHEPVVPSSTTLMLVVAALDALGAPLDAQRVHRMELVAAAAGRAEGALVDEDTIVAALRHAEGYLSRVPGGACSGVFLNKAEDRTWAPAQRIAQRLAPPYAFAAAGSARGGRVGVSPSLAAIVLAAGASTRMGRPKMLLPLNGGTVLSASVAPLMAAGLDPVVVVLGAGADEIRRASGLVDDPRLRVVVNEAWKDGMASSLRRGLAECGEASAAVVALGDQPGVATDVVARLIGAFRRSGAPLVLPVHGKRTGHPVLFSRALFGELRAVVGDVGGRDVVRRHRARAASIEAELPRDLDTADDYRALVEGRPARPSEGLEI